SQPCQPQFSVCGTTSPVDCWLCSSATARHAKNDRTWKSKKHTVTSHNHPFSEAPDLPWIHTIVHESTRIVVWDLGGRLDINASPPTGLQAIEVRSAKWR